MYFLVASLGNTVGLWLRRTLQVSAFMAAAAICFITSICISKDVFIIKKQTTMLLKIEIKVFVCWHLKPCKQLSNKLKQSCCTGTGS